MHQLQHGASVKLDNWLGATASSSPALRNTQSSAIGHRPLNVSASSVQPCSPQPHWCHVATLGWRAFLLLPRSAPQLSLPSLLKSASDPELCDPKDINTEKKWQLPILLRKGLLSNSSRSVSSMCEQGQKRRRTANALNPVVDGGGVRGLSSLLILKQLMKRVNPEDPPKPCDYFDLIGGTSTGG